MLRVKDLVKVYIDGESKVEALNNVTINFRNHEFVSILGPSGCGKTTLLNIIGGLDRYTSGDLTISGISTKYFSDKHWDSYRNSSVGFVFQNYNLIPHLNIIENVAMSLSLTGVSKAERMQRSKEALEKVGLNTQLKKLPSQLSGGQMQRVAIARALINRPDVILADEPTGALDSELSVQVMDILKEISNETLVIMVTHNESLARDYSTRIINILDGQVVSDSNPYSLDDCIRKEIAAIENLSVGNEEKAVTFASLLVELGNSSIKNADLEDLLNNKIENYQLSADTNENSKLTKLFKKKSKKLDNGNDKNINKDSSVRRKRYKPLKNRADKRVIMPFKSTSMQYKTAIALSVKNLISKRRRTLLTAFAGSIGIISLALVLSLSYGYNKYIERMQKNMLSTIPVATYEYTLDYKAFTKMFDNLGPQSQPEFNDPGNIAILKNKADGFGSAMDMVGSFSKSVGENYISEEYLKHVKKLSPKYYDAMTVIYGTQFNMISERRGDDGGEEKYYSDVSKVPPPTTALTIGTSVLGNQGLQAKNWHQLVGNEEYMTKYYDIVKGRYPQAKNELILVLDTENQVPYDVFESLGLDIYKREEGKVVFKDGKPQYLDNLSYDDLFNPEKVGKLKLLGNDEYYTKNAASRFEAPNNKNQEELKERFDKPANIDIRIVGVMKPNPKNITMGQIVGNHFCYLPELGEYIYNEAQKSEVTIAQREKTKHIYDETGKRKVIPKTNAQGDDIGTYEKISFESVIDGTKKYNDSGNILSFIMGGLEGSHELQRLGATNHPKFIAVFAKNFDAKQSVIDHLNSWNSGKPARDFVEYFDMSEMFIHNIKTIMKLMTIVLLSVASISLVVSSIMIGVITGNSVYERTREIGMLRSLGARKKDIARVFNTETGLIGLLAGVIGIVLPYILIPLVNLGLYARFNVKNILVLNPLHAGLLILLSLLLTFIAGIIPSQSAAKRDIVKSLRIE